MNTKAGGQPLARRTVLDSGQLGCYVVTGRISGLDSDAEHASIANIAARAAAGGAGFIQVRSKPITVRELTALTVRVADAVAAANPETKVLIDDRVDVAAALQDTHHVHGVHIGQDDLDPRLARKLLGADAIIGLTTGTLDLVRQSNRYSDVIDYIGAGPFRPTPTKDSGRTPLGVEGYPPLVAVSQVPVVAIGDVQLDDAAALGATGVAGLAIVRGFMNAADPQNYASRVLREFRWGRGDRS